MDNDINQPIVKESSIVQGCSTGHHLFSSDKSMLGNHGGVLEIRMKCTLCGIEITEPVPGLGASLPLESIPMDEGVIPEQTLERGVPVENTNKEPEPPVEYEDPMEGIRQRPFADPPWANIVRDKYKRDKSLDNFWGDIWDIARNKK